MSPIDSNLKRFYPTKVTADKKEIRQLRIDSMVEIYSAYVGQDNEERIYNIYTMTQPLTETDNLEAGVFYVVFNNLHLHDSKTSNYGSNVAGYIFMLSWDSYYKATGEQIDDSNLSMGYVSLSKIRGTEESNLPTMRYSIATKLAERMDVETVLDWFGYQRSGNIYSFTPISQGPITLNYSTQGFDVEGLN